MSWRKKKNRNEEDFITIPYKEEINFTWDLLIECVLRHLLTNRKKNPMEFPIFNKSCAHLWFELCCDFILAKYAFGESIINKCNMPLVLY